MYYLYGCLKCRELVITLAKKTFICSKCKKLQRIKGLICWFISNDYFQMEKAKKAIQKNPRLINKGRTLSIKELELI